MDTVVPGGSDAAGESASQEAGHRLYVVAPKRYDLASHMKKLSIDSQAARKALETQRVTTEPGSILADVRVLLDFIGSRGTSTSSQQGNLPAAVLPELNQHGAWGWRRLAVPHRAHLYDLSWSSSQTLFLGQTGGHGIELKSWPDRRSIDLGVPLASGSR